MINTIALHLALTSRKSTSREIDPQCGYGKGLPFLHLLTQKSELEIWMLESLVSGR